MWTDALTPVRILLRGIGLLLLCLVWLLPTVICQGAAGQAIHVGRRTLAEFMLNAWSGMLSRVFGVRPRVTGLPLAGPVLLVANHISWLDIIALHSVAAMSFVAKAEIEEWPLAGFLATRGATIYHRRGDHDSASGVVAQMVAKLESGGRVAIFAEGGILPGEQIKRFHARLFKVAVEVDCPVQPVMIRYLRKGRRDPELTFLRGESFGVNLLRLLGRPRSIADLRFLEPFAASGRQRRDLAEQAQRAVENAYSNPTDEGLLSDD